MADRVRAKLIYKHGMKVRSGIRPVVDARGLIARPEFVEMGLDSVEHLMDATDLNERQLVLKIAEVEYWVCEGKKANTPIKAIEFAFAARKKHVKIDLAARALSKDLNLPALDGSVKQISWAENIRSQFAKKHPGSDQLTEQTSAAWWIENRSSLD